MVRVLATSSFAETHSAFKLITNAGISQICCQNNFRTAPGIEKEQIEKEKNSLLQISPNPSNEYVNISWSLSAATLTGKERLVVTDMLGRVVYEKQVFSPKFTHQLRLANFTSGSYIVSLVNASGITTQKLTIVK